MQDTKTLNDMIDMKHPAHAQHLYMSLLNNRYAILKNHSIALEDLSSIYMQWKLFFSQKRSEKEKHLYTLTTDDGYVPINVEHAKDSTEPDLKEFYQIHLEALQVSDNPCSEETKNLFSNFVDLGEYLIRIIHEMLPSEIKSSMTTSLESSVMSSKRHCMRFIHYPPCGDNDKAYRSAPHDDICLLTIIPPTRGEGLMMRKDMGWTQQNMDTSLVVFNSEMLEICTRGYMKSMTHQVTTDIHNNASSTSRYSMPFFVHPHSNTTLKEELTSYIAIQQRIMENGLDNITKLAGTSINVKD